MDKHKKEDCCTNSSDGSTTTPKVPIDHLDSSEIENSVSTTFRVTGMDCGDEVSAINQALSIPQVIKVDTNIMAAKIIVSHAKSLSNELIKNKIESTGVKVVASLNSDLSVINKRRLNLVIASGLFLGLGVLVHFFSDAKIITIVVFSITVILSGILIFPKAWNSIKRKSLDMNVLMTVAVFGAFLIQEYLEAATIIFLFSLAELLEAYSVERGRKAIREVLNLAPPKASLIQDNGIMLEIPLEDIKIGDRVLVKIGERIPVDGDVIKGTSLVNQSPLTGESIPVEKSVGDKVFAGTINDSGIIEVKTLSSFEKSKVSQIIRLIDDAQKNKAPSEKFVDSFAKVYTPIIFIVSILTFMLPPIFLDGSWSDWFYRALVLLVIACPCALVISTPVSVVSGLAAMAKRGVLVKGGAFLEALGRVKAVALDKTGTITEGKPKVQNILLINSTDEKSILEFAASIANHSSHPLSQAIVEHAKKLNISLKEATLHKIIPGKGTEASIDGHEYFLGNHRFAHYLGVCDEKLESLLSEIEAKSQSVVIIGHRPHLDCVGEVIGIITLADTVRENSKKAILDLHKAGVEKVIMLSGDNQTIVSNIASQVGIDQFIGELLPEDKVERVKDLVKTYKFVAMVGDGINDAPALAQASVGIAMGGIGSDTAIEAADVTLMQDDLEQLSTAILMGKKTLSIIQFNISFALSIKFIFLALAIFGYSNLWIAVFADTGASLLVIFNGLRLLKTPSY